MSHRCSLWLPAPEGLGDTKQEGLNKWKPWMFILGHSSAPRKPARDVRNTPPEKQGCDSDLERGVELLEGLSVCRGCD